VECLEGEERFIPGLAKKALEEATITPEDLQPWADFEHPDSDSYGRKLVYLGQNFELMVMSWVEGDMSAIHDHGYAQWGAVQLFGPAEHAVFKMDEENVLTTQARWRCNPGEVLAVGHNLIHQMGNIGETPYLTLHLYGSYDFEGGITNEAQLYELDEERIQFTNGGVFFGLPEDDIVRRENGIKADFPTTLRHKVELLKRLIRKNGSERAGLFASEHEAALGKELFTKSIYDSMLIELENLSAASEARRNKYKDILDQEVLTTAKLQLWLLEKALVKAENNDLKTTLTEALKADTHIDFSRAFLNIIQQLN